MTKSETIILDMLAKGQITQSQASELLDKCGDKPSKPSDKPSGKGIRKPRGHYKPRPDAVEKLLGMPVEERGEDWEEVLLKAYAKSCSTKNEECLYLGEEEGAKVWKVSRRSARKFGQEDRRTPVDYCFTNREPLPIEELDASQLRELGYVYTPLESGSYALLGADHRQIGPWDEADNITPEELRTREYREELHNALPMPALPGRVEFRAADVLRRGPQIGQISASGVRGNPALEMESLYRDYSEVEGRGEVQTRERLTARARMRAVHLLGR
jgi:hypothetical protein